MRNEQVAQTPQRRLFLEPPLHNVCLWPPLPKKGRVPVGLETIRKGSRPPRKLCQNVSKLSGLIFSHFPILFQQAIHPSRPTGQNINIPSSSSSSSLTRERRVSRSLAADLLSRPCEERPCSNGGGVRELVRRAEGGQSMSEVPGLRKTEHLGPSQIPRAVAGSSVSLPSKASPSRSLSSDSERGLRSERGPIPRLQSSFTGRLGQPPRGPLSLHMYSRKNVFLQHSIHTADLQALAQQEG